ncbi:tRNA uridine-5-carboxymethylaminomethyl(34) synthesis GTPase MnmE [Rhizobium sp. 0TCS1.26]|uniref:tRNA uridine-5-carboxymethylaminomethyl(34) synthesis GTPase MnmE n=1 Tax=Rhizobium sp. 0TCS1.26 TaxID=3142623 RepID=UPI003D297A05
MMSSDTIFALSSGPPPSGVAVVRISGPAAFDAVGRLAGDLPKRRATLLRAVRNRDGDLIDKGLVLSFPGPRSFTGEDCVELQLHGGRAVVAAVSAELSHLGLRLAEAGEFTHRAFDNGKMDLVEVEGLGDLIAADTEMQRRLAIEQSAGGLSTRYAAWANRLTKARALIEAELDFADEDDVPGSVSEQVWADVAQVQREIALQIDATQKADAVRDAFKVVIIGPPNAGKSSFMNAFAKRDVAIVTEIAGTTRDVLEVELDLQGFLVRLSDTAGLRETTDVVEREGVRRALGTAQKADLLLALTEIDSDTKWSVGHELNIPTLRIGTKSDLHPWSRDAFDFVVSTSTGVGLDDVRKEILARVELAWNSIASLGAGRMRHVEHLTRASNFLAEALSGAELDIRAESLRLAAMALGRITGRVDVEDLLDVIFSEFCIGK